MKIRLVVLLGSSLLLVGCSSGTATQTGGDTTHHIGDTTPAAGDTTPTPDDTTPTPDDPAPVVEDTTGGDCEGGTTRVQVGTDYVGTIAGGRFPNNCTEMCIWSPDAGSLTIGVSGPALDLDLYVDPVLSVLTNTSSSGTASWESNAYGTGPEQVTIYNPQGRYYAQVCSYDGTGTTFVLSTEVSN